MKDNKQTDKKKLSAHKFLHFYRNRVMNVLVIVILVMYFVYRMLYIIPQELQRCYDLLFENVQQAEQYQQYANEANELNLTIQDQDYLSACNLFIGYIQNGYEVKVCIDGLNSATDDYDSVFYLQSDGTIISSSDRDPLSLTDEETEQLISEGTLQPAGGSLRYFALQSGDDYMIARVDEACAAQVTMDVLHMVSLNGFIYNNETLDVIEADEESFAENNGSLLLGKPIRIDRYADSDIQIRFVSPYDSGISKFTHLKLGATKALDYQNAGYSICAYIPVSEIISNILVKSGLPTLLCLGFICLTIFGSLHFRKVVLKKKEDDENEKKEKKPIRLPFNCYLDPELTSGILFMQLFMGILVIFCSIVLLTISRFSLSYEDMKYNLEQLVSTEESCQATLDECWDAYSSPVVGMAEGIVNNFLMSGDVTTDENIQEKLKLYVDSTFLEEIAVYDRDGENIYTTSAGIGYPLTTDPASPMYSFWELMSGDKEYIIARSDNKDGIIYCAMKRSDDVGIAVLSFSDQGFSELEQKLSPVTVTAGFNYSSSCVFVDKSTDSDAPAETNIGYRVSSSGKQISCETPNLPVLAEGEKFCGFRTVNDQKCFVVGLGDESRSLFYFTPVSEVVEGLGESIATYIIFLILICLLDLLGCAVYTEESTSPEDESEESEPEFNVTHHLITHVKKRVTLSDKMEDSQKIIWQHSFYSTIVLIAVMLLLDVLLNENSMLVFLIKGNWEKGANLFAFSMIILVILACCLLLRFLRFLFEELTDNFPPRFATVIQMMHSILKIVIVVVLVIYCANELGIDTKTILASVGISGLALGIAAKDTINDMLNGLFIIMDGRIQVGDFVEVNGFYGEVIKIGIRTTKLMRYNVEMSINNSDMKNLYNDSKGESSVYIKFSVAKDTDLELLKKIITGATDRFQEACRGRLNSGFYYIGVNSFDAHSITCGIFAMTEEKYRKSLTYKCNHVLVELLRENGISIGNDLVIGAEDDRGVKIFGNEKPE